MHDQYPVTEKERKKEKRQREKDEGQTRGGKKD